MSKRNVAGTVNDPTLPKTPIEIGGKIYNLCLDFGALAEAESAINRELMAAGRTDFVNLLYAMAEENLRNTRILFAAGVRTFHPELNLEAAAALVGPDCVFRVATALRAAWAAAMPEKAADPIKAQAAK